MIRAVLGVALCLTAAVSTAAEPEGLHQALKLLAAEGRFSGAVVIRGSGGEKFSRGYGPADPFSGRPFTPDTAVDSGSLAKPVTATIVLSLARDKRIDLDAPAERYLPEFPWSGTTVRQLLAHSAGLADYGSEQALVGKSNERLVAESLRHPRAFPPGSAFAYCNVCYSALAALIERVSSRPYLEVARDHAALPSDIELRPPRLADWADRAVGYRLAGGRPQRADSYDDERFYGSANLSVSANQLSGWGEQWWSGRLEPILEDATSPARIAGSPAGLSRGNWYCAPDRRRCHYLGHHEGFHHMLYWDRDRRLSVAMVSNNSLAPGLQQRLQRAIIAFAEGRESDAARELGQPLADMPIAPGTYRSEFHLVTVANGSLPVIRRSGLDYAAFPIGAGVHYAPGLDIYLAGTSDGKVRMLGLYEDLLATHR